MNSLFFFLIGIFLGALAILIRHHPAPVRPFFHSFTYMSLDLHNGLARTDTIRPILITLWALPIIIIYK